MAPCSLHLRFFASSLHRFFHRFFASSLLRAATIYVSRDDTRLADRKKLISSVCSIGPGFLEQSVWWITRRLRRLAPLPSPSP